MKSYLLHTTRLLLTVLTFEYLSPVARAFAEENTPGPDCNPGLLSPDELEKADAYNLFGAYRANHDSIADLIEAARTDLSLRESLNQKIDASPELKKVAARGLGMHQWLKKFLTEQFSEDASNPYRQLYRVEKLQKEFKTFQNSLVMQGDRPTPEHEAEVKARSDTANRYGLENGFNLSQISTDARHYFGRQKNRYLLLEQPGRVRDPRGEQAKFKLWLKKSIASYQQMRVENYRTMLLKITELENTDLIFGVDRSKKPTFFNKNPNPKRLSTASAVIRDKELKNLALHFEKDVKNAQPLVINTAFNWASEKNSLARHWSLYHLYPRGQRAPFPEVDKTESLVFSSPHQTFEKSFRRLKLVPTQTYAIATSDLLNAITQYVNKFGKNSQPGSLEFSYEMMTRLALESDLLKTIKDLEEALAGSNLVKFEKELKTAVEQEKALVPSTLGYSPLTRLRALEAASAEDSLTGLEWFGYSINSSYWKNRDYFARTKAEKPIEYLRKNLKDWHIKKNEFTRYLTNAVAVYTLMGLFAWGLNEYIKFAVSFSTGGSGSSQTESSSARSAEQGFAPNASIKPNDTNAENGVSFIVFRTDQDSDFPIPRYFNHVSIVEISDPDPVELINLEPQTEDEPTSDLIVRNNVPVYDLNGFVALPNPADFELVDYSLKQSGAVVPATLYRHIRSGLYMLQIPKDFRGKPLQLNLKLRQKSRSELAAVQTKNPLFSNLDRNRLRAINADIKDAGLDSLTSAFDRMLQKRGPISVQDIAEMIATTQIYSLRPGSSFFLAEYLTRNPFHFFRRYLYKDALYIDCEVSNELLQNILQAYYGDPADVLIEPQFSLVSSGAGQYLGTIGHRRTRLSAVEDGYFTDQLIVDATPVFDPLGLNLEPSERYSRAAMDKAKAQAIADLAQEKAAEEEKRKANPTVIPNTDRINDRRYSFTVVEEKASEEELARAKSFHQTMIERVQEQRKQLLNDGQFKNLVYSGHNYPSVRIYRIARHFLRYAENDIKIDELFHELNAYYPGLGLTTPETEDELKTQVSLIVAREKELWEKLAYQAARQGKAQFTWALDDELKSMTFNLLDSLHSYSWQPREVPDTEQAVTQ